MGEIESLLHERLEGAEGVRERLILEVGPSAGIVTILVGGTDGVATEETIRGLYDSLRSTCLAKDDDSVILGGGSLHIAASLKVREVAENCAGRERLSMEAFSRALESILEPTKSMPCWNYVLCIELAIPWQVSPNLANPELLKEHGFQPIHSNTQFR